MDKEYEAARAWAIRKRESLHLPVVGVTGSVGKTTMKEFLVRFIGGGYSVVCNEGSRNIAETMVLNIMSIKKEHQAAVFEFGVDAPGQMLEMVNIARPTIPVLTGISESHMESFGSLDAVYDEKSKLLFSMPRGGLLIANGEDDRLMNYLKKDDRLLDSQVITYGFRSECSVYADHIQELGLDGYRAVIHAEQLGIEAFEISTPIIGKQLLLHMVGAIMLALLMHASVSKVQEIAEGLEFIPRRMQLIRNSKYTIIDDSYNASAVSMKAALEFVRHIMPEDGRRVAILGDMLELGAYTQRAHEEIGEYAHECVDVLICVGEYSKQMLRRSSLAADNSTALHAYSYDNTDELIRNVGKIIQPNDLILVKASNRMGFDQIVKNISN